MIENAAGRLSAAAPCYVKTHSMGEYVFDHAWADAYHRAGLDYYPKLQVCVPFTPATGRRLLVSREAGPLALPTLIAGLKAWHAKVEASSLHVTKPFFDAIGRTMADRILLVMAKRDGRYIAGAINFIGDDALYGRNWGCVEEHPFLHFEVCYYQAIEWAITHGLKRVEAGAQGEHKLARGYRAVPTYSAHDIPDKRFARAIDDYLTRERAAIDEALEEYGELAPFKKVAS